MEKDKVAQELYRFDGCKLLWHMDRVHAHYRDGKRIYPLHIDVGATKLCNMRCIYCYGIYQKFSNEMIAPHTLVNLFSDAPKLGVKSLAVTGDGEPTLNPAIYDAVRAGKDGGLDIGFATNGVALDEKKIKILLDSCTWIRFNVSAVDEESYKSIHGVSQWGCVQDNIRKAVRLKKEGNSNCTIGLQMVLIPQCREQIVPESKFALDAGVDYFVIKQFSDPGCEEMSRFNLNWYDSPRTLATLREVEAMSTEKTRIIPKFGMIHSKGKRPYDRCLDVPLIFQISGSSKCYPCGYLFNNDRFCYGDLKKQTLKEILDSEKYWSIIKYMQTKFDVHKDCHGCCRHDFTNKFIWEYTHPPKHINFI